MADKAIGSLVEATVINDADRFVLEQSGQAKQISGATMISELAAALDGHGGISSIDLVSGDGNVKTYRITFTDGTTYDYEVRDGESGNYAVVAGNLAPYSDASGATQSIPFLNQGTGRGNGSATVSAGNYCQLKKKLGNTVAVNQLCDYSKLRTGTYSGITVTISGDTLIANGTASANAYIPLFNPTQIATISGHKYLVIVPSGTAVTYYDDSSTRQYNNATSSIIFTGSGVDITPSARISNGTTVTNVVISMSLIDITLWFGNNDNIPSDLLSHPENLGRYYAGSLAYAAGYLDSADGTVMRSIGRNIFDKGTMTVTDKYINDSNGNANTLVGSICTDFIEVMPNTAYYIKTDATSGRWGAWYDADKNYVSGISGGQNKTAPANARYMRFTIKYGTSGDGNKDAFCLSLYYPGESGYNQYYPYSVLAEVDTGSEVLRGVEGSRDEKLPSGAITRNRAVIDLGTLNWAKGSKSNGYFYAELSGMKQQTVAAQLFSGISGKYVATLSRTNADWNITNEDKVIGTRHTTNYVCIVDSAFASYSGVQVATALSGVMLEYPLATPTTEQGTAFPENIPCNSVGSMSWENTNGIPQGAELFYPYDYAGTLDSMIDALPSADGTYTFKATVANGKITYSWVAD